MKRSKYNLNIFPNFLQQTGLLLLSLSLDFGFIVFKIKLFKKIILYYRKLKYEHFTQAY
jgi:hypothetical protein